MNDELNIDALAETLRNGAPVVTVQGMGYVGLPLSLALVRSGCTVFGVDVDAAKVAALQRGHSHIREVPPHDLLQALQTGRFTVATETTGIARSNAVLMCVPTPFTPQKEPDISHISSAAEAIAANLRPGQLIVLRSTSYPGTTREVVLPILESSGLRAGRDFFLAFAPERIDPGNAQFKLERIPVVVGGVNEPSTRLAVALVGRVSGGTVVVSSPDAAEMSKLLENIFRNVNIALVNQIAQFCERAGLDVWEVINAAATKPYGFMPFKPGLVGGHCIPVDPYYLAWKAREYDFHMDFIELAARVNEDMPFYVVNRLLAVLHELADTQKPLLVLVLGIAFKKDVDDARYSPAIKVIELLQKRQIQVLYHDPYVPSFQIGGTVMESTPLTPQLIGDADCLVILTDHSCIDYEEIVRRAKLVFDVRNATRDIPFKRNRIVKL